MTLRLIHLAAAAPSLLALIAALPAAAQEDSPWSGWYVGGNVGADWGDSSTKATVAAGTGAIVIPTPDINLINATGDDGSNRTGFTGGIEGGFNYQTGSLLLGLETDFVALEVSQRQTVNFQSTLPLNPPATYQLNQRAKTSWMWSLRPRIGYVAGPLLIYGTGGIATSDIKVDFGLSDNRTPQNVVTGDHSKTKVGWIAGLGAGYAISPNISVKGEWLYADFGSVSTSVTSDRNFVTLTSEAKVRSNILRVGADYRF
jgi:outer membrane immunogenic protein